MILKPGSLLQNGRYRIEKELGQGGFGITYLGVQSGLERKVAIKEFFMKSLCNRDSDTSGVYTLSQSSSAIVERFRTKFIKEAQSIAKLSHKNIISVIDIFEDNNTAYYVMEYHAGGSLSEKVSNKPLAEEEALVYIRQLASALEYLHSRNMMHLDVKPANVLLNSVGEAVLIDFGLAKQYDEKGMQTSTTPVGISHGYAPLEQYTSNGVGSFSPETDIYSLGATLYKLLTRLTPPEASFVHDEGLPELPDNISKPVREAIVAAMQPRKKDRPQSVAEFLKLLDCKEPLEDKETEVAVETVDTAETTRISASENKVSPDENRSGSERTVVEQPVWKKPFEKKMPDLSHVRKQLKNGIAENSRALKILLVAVVAAVVLIGGFYLIRCLVVDNRVEDAETMYEEAVNEYSDVEKPLLKITSNPSGAEVYVEDDYVGTTPLEYTLEPNSYKSVRIIKSGYEDVKFDDHFISGPYKLNVEMKKRNSSDSQSDYYWY